MFIERRVKYRLDYRMLGDQAFHTISGEVRGFRGTSRVEHRVARTSSGFRLDGRLQRGLDACAHLDLGFTPSTNLFQIRSLNLARGEAADVPVAWLDLAKGRLNRLEQRYERRSATAYWYDAPRFRYHALLEVLPNGFVARYPKLWELEP